MLSSLLALQLETNELTNNASQKKDVKVRGEFGSSCPRNSCGWLLWNALQLISPIYDHLEEELVRLCPCEMDDASDMELNVKVLLDLPPFSFSTDIRSTGTALFAVILFHDDLFSSSNSSILLFIRTVLPFDHKKTVDIPSTPSSLNSDECFVLTPISPSHIVGTIASPCMTSETAYTDDVPYHEVMLRIQNCPDPTEANQRRSTNTRSYQGPLSPGADVGRVRSGSIGMTNPPRPPYLSPARPRTGATKGAIPCTDKDNYHIEYKYPRLPDLRRDELKSPHPQPLHRSPMAGLVEGAGTYDDVNAVSSWIRMECVDSSDSHNTTEEVSRPRVLVSCDSEGLGSPYPSSNINSASITSTTISRPLIPPSPAKAKGKDVSTPLIALLTPAGSNTNGSTGSSNSPMSLNMSSSDVGSFTIHDTWHTCSSPELFDFPPPPPPPPATTSVGSGVVVPPEDPQVSGPSTHRRPRRRRASSPMLEVVGRCDTDEFFELDEF